MDYENNERTVRISIDGVASVADLVDQKMPLEETISWNQFFKEFVIPSTLDCKKHNINYLNTKDRHDIKRGVNEEFARRKNHKRLFVRKDIGVYLLNGETAVSAKLFLTGVHKVNNANNNHMERCRALALSNGLSDEDKRLLSNTANTYDGNKTLLAGTMARMRSIPKPVKKEAMAILGCDFD